MHGKDIIVGSTEPSRTSSPAPVPTSANSGVQGLAKRPTGSSQKINTSVVEVEATFQASADDLFGLLTDEKRIPMWSRAQAKVTLRLRGEMTCSYMLTTRGRARLHQIRSMSYLGAACVASISHLHRARKSNRPGHFKARPGQMVKL